jgi:hypothetical protein
MSYFFQHYLKLGIYRVFKLFVHSTLEIKRSGHRTSFEPAVFNSSGNKIDPLGLSRLEKGLPPARVKNVRGRVIKEMILSCGLTTEYTFSKGLIAGFLLNIPVEAGPPDSQRDEIQRV